MCLARLRCGLEVAKMGNLLCVFDYNLKRDNYLQRNSFYCVVVVVCFLCPLLSDLHGVLLGTRNHLNCHTEFFSWCVKNLPFEDMLISEYVLFLKFSQSIYARLLPHLIW